MAKYEDNKDRVNVGSPPITIEKKKDFKIAGGQDEPNKQPNPERSPKREEPVSKRNAT